MCPSLAELAALCLSKCPQMVRTEAKQPQKQNAIWRSVQDQLPLSLRHSWLESHWANVGEEQTGQTRGSGNTQLQQKRAVIKNISWAYTQQFPSRSAPRGRPVNHISGYFFSIMRRPDSWFLNPASWTIPVTPLVQKNSFSYLTWNLNGIMSPPTEQLPPSATSEIFLPKYSIKSDCYTH